MRWWCRSLPKFAEFRIKGRKPVAWHTLKSWAETCLASGMHRDRLKIIAGYRGNGVSNRYRLEMPKHRSVRILIYESNDGRRARLGRDRIANEQ